MTLLEDWRALLVPNETFQAQDLWQLLIIILLFAISSRILGAKANAVEIIRSNPLLWLKRNLCFVTLWVAILVATGICFLTQSEAPVFRFFSFLGGIWMFIGLLTSVIPSRFWSESVASVCYFFTGILSLSLLDNSIHSLQELHFSIGTNTISAWGFLTGIFAFAFTLWVSFAMAKVIETQIKRVPRLSPSLKVLITKITRITFILIATAVALSSMGIDMSALAVLGGAIGLGVGFGLQKVVSNFISGILLLVDNSIKPGDVIEIDGTYGWINHLRARYASVITRDGTEHLIPNEDLITQRVINWTFTNNLVRMKVPIGVSYDSDPHHCIQLVIDAAQSIDRVLSEPAPICHATGFGDNAIDLELRFWISDPTNGITNVKSQVLLNIWDTFKANNIEIPYPQRDLHIRTSTIAMPLTPASNNSQN
jgi:small-conductance mechanosensitive channel